MRLSKMALIAAPTKELDVSLRQRSDLIGLLSPTIDTVLRFQRVLGAISLFRPCLLQTYYLTTRLLLAGQLLAWHALLVSRFMVLKTALLSQFAGHAAWNCKTMQRLRKKLEFEFFTFILGCGNFLFVAMLWPGWLVLGLAGIVAWQCLVG